MLKKFIIPAFFVSLLLVSGCTKDERKSENLFDFSISEEEPSNVLPIELSEKIVEDKKQPPKTLEKAAQKPKEIITQVEKSPEPVAEEEEVVEQKPQTTNDSILPNFIKKYNIRYLSFDVADIIIEANDDGFLRIFSKANGFIDYLFGWRDYSISNFKIAGNRITPHSFKTKLLFKKKIREIEVQYGEDGKQVTFEQVTPPDNRDKRPAVDEALKRSVYDPLSAAIEARRLVIEAVKNNNFNSKGRYNFSLPIYEGRRRTELMFDISGKKIDGNYLLKLYRKPVAGYTNNELDEIKKGDAVIDIYLDGKSFIPVKAEGRNFLGTARASFVANCKSFEECAKKI